MKNFATMLNYILATLLISIGTTQAQSDAFHAGTAIPEFGPIADVEVTMPIPDGTHFKVAFDVTEKATDGQINRTMVSAARFINMHVANGVSEDHIQLALVFHGGASLDLTNHDFYAARNDGADNGSAEALATLLKHNVRIIICGQSAAAHGIANADLLPGVEVALSAMTAHALLQHDGYSLNPF